MGDAEQVIVVHGIPPRKPFASGRGRAERVGIAALVAGLSDEAAVSLLRTRGVAGVRRVE